MLRCAGKTLLVFLPAACVWTLPLKYIYCYYLSCSNASRSTARRINAQRMCEQHFKVGLRLRATPRPAKFLHPPMLSASVLWRCWLGGRKGIRPVKTEWWGTGVVICLERGADLHMAQLMPLPLTVSCFSKIQIGLPFWYRLTWVILEKGPLNGVCVWCF